MKRLILLVALSFAISCGSEKRDEKEEQVQPADTISEYNPAKGLSDGINETRYPNGQLKTKGNVLNSQRHGTWESWYENGTKWSESTYSYGVLEGKTVSYFPNGQVRYIGYYENNKKSGKWMTFNEAGDLVEEKEFSN